MNLLCLCGSLRARSSHRAVLQALARSENGLTIRETDLIAALPLFNPDDDADGQDEPGRKTHKGPQSRPFVLNMLCMGLT